MIAPVIAVKMTSGKERIPSDARNPASATTISPSKRVKKKTDAYPYEWMNPRIVSMGMVRRVSYFLRRSRISVRSFTSAEGSGAGAGASSSLRFIVLIPFTNKKRAKATIVKTKAAWMNFP